MKDATIYRMFLALLGLVVFVSGVNIYEVAWTSTNQGVIGQVEIIAGAILLIVAVFLGDILEELQNTQATS
jgi:uncharacterized membrane protein